MLVLIDITNLDKLKYKTNTKNIENKTFFIHITKVLQFYSNIQYSKNKQKKYTYVKKCL